MNAQTMNQNAMNINQTQSEMQTSRGITRYHLTFFNILKVEIIKLLCTQFTWWCTALFILIPLALTSFFSFIVNVFTMYINKGDGISLSSVIFEANRQSCSTRREKVNGFWRYYSNCNMDQYINILKKYHFRSVYNYIAVCSSSFYCLRSNCSISRSQKRNTKRISCCCSKT